MSKSLAVECMHRLVKHFKDASEDKPISDEILEIIHLWNAREHFEGMDLNAGLTALRKLRAGDITGFGWKPLGRRGITSG